jgi:hypothetical protein
VPPATVKILKFELFVAVVPSPGDVPAERIAPPADEMQDPLGVKAAQLTTLTATFAPSGTGVEPSESTSPLRTI